MKNFLAILFLLIIATLSEVAVGVASEVVVGAKSPSGADASSAVDPIRTSIDSYVAAFNAGDAKSLANHWSLEAEYVLPTGEKLQGRQQLEADFAEYFKQVKNAKLELGETNISVLSPHVAVETGVAWVTGPDQEPRGTEYKAVHVKTPEGWKIDSLTEQELPVAPPSHHEQLQSLEWMVGTWVDSDENSSIETTCRWTANQNFLVRSFKVYVQDRVDFEGTQIIGWDPDKSAIRSWLFDSDGGFGVGHWSEAENRWTVRTLSVLPDGKRASATQIYDKIDDNTLQFRSLGRQIDGELVPDIDPVTISRVQE